MFSLLSFIFLLFLACPFFVHASRNSYMCYYWSMMFSTSACTLVCFTVVWSTDCRQRFSFSLSSFLSSYLGHFPLISGVLRCLPMFYPSLDTTMRVHMGVKGSIQGWNFRLFHLQLSCRGLNCIVIFRVFMIIPRQSIFLRHHHFLPRSCEVSWMYKYRSRIPLLCMFPKKCYYLPVM